MRSHHLMSPASAGLDTLASSFASIGVHPRFNLFGRREGPGNAALHSFLERLSCSHDNESRHVQRPEQTEPQVSSWDRGLRAPTQKRPERNSAQPSENRTAAYRIPAHHERHLEGPPPCGSNSLSCFAALCF